jgi:hypothetical protein
MDHSTNECKNPGVEFSMEVMAQLNDNQCRLVEDSMENGDMGFQWDMAIGSFICLDREIVIHQISLKIVLSIEMQIKRKNLFVEDIKCLISSNEIHV